ncbi:MAG: succinate dehydrogenase / fumarate reductase cytochrome b subunit [Candidatus Deianiraeaceae bacterium]|jgi:succinate dehydrogenase / fumarate reductase cytochrome b subunit
MLNNRPLSPHLSIYKPQITSSVSIIGRMSGVYVYLFLIISLWLVIYSTYEYTSPMVILYIVLLALKVSTPLISVISYIILIVTVFCFTFFSGTLIRHILWDHSLLLDLKSSSVFGYLIIAFSVLLSVSSVVFIAMQ